MNLVSSQKVLSNCTLLISGPLLSRVGEDQLIEKFSLLSELKNVFGLRILISTYHDELSLSLKDYQFRFILNDDPGEDCFYTGQNIFRKERNRVTRNITRMLSTTSRGLSQVDTKYVIKTRVEILPSKIEFAHALSQLIEDDQQSRMIVFLAEHYTGLTYSEEKPLLLWVPDVFQIMRTKDCAKLWAGALVLWRDYKTYFVGKSFNVDLANEQILGLSLVHNFIKPISKRHLRNFHRYNCSIRFIKANFKFEFNMFKSVYYDTLYLGEGRFRWDKKLTPTIALPLTLTRKQRYFIAIAFFIRGKFFQLKSLVTMIFHLFFRFIFGLERNKSKK